MNSTPHEPVPPRRVKSLRVLVTGGCGFIGSNLVRLLLRKGMQVKVLDNLSVGSEANLPPGVELLIGDIRDRAKVFEAVVGADAVVHLAAHAGVAESVVDPQTCFEINVQGTLNILEATVARSIGRFVFASSNAAVGEHPGPVHEDVPARPTSPYGASKLAAEAYCSAFSNSYGLNTVVLRFANVYGPYSTHKTSVVAKFLRQLKSGKTLTIYGGGTQTRDFIHASDVSNACLLALEAPKGAKLYQIGSGVPTSILTLVDLIVELSGQKVTVEYAPPRPGEIRHSCALIDRACRELGFKPTISLREGLIMLLQGQLGYCQ